MLNTRAVQVDVADVTIVMIEIIAIGVAVGAIGWITSKDANLILSLFVLLCGFYRVTVERAKGSPRARGRGSSGGSDSGRSPRNGREHGRSGFRNSSNSRSGGKGGGDK